MGGSETEKKDAQSAHLGPFDADAYGDPGDLFDAGALWLPKTSAAGLQFSVDKKTHRVEAAIYVTRDSAMQLQVFAAPKSRGIWKNVCADTRLALARQGGVSQEVEGEYGSELHVQIPTPQGAKAHIRIVGVEGPRWMLKATMTGAAALSQESAAVFVDILHSVVVNRGQSPHPPHEMLDLHLPTRSASSLISSDPDTDRTVDHAQSGQ